MPALFSLFLLSVFFMRSSHGGTGKCQPDAGDYWISSGEFLKENFNCSGSEGGRRLWKKLTDGDPATADCKSETIRRLLLRWDEPHERNPSCLTIPQNLHILLAGEALPKLCEIQPKPSHNTTYLLPTLAKLHLLFCMKPSGFCFVTSNSRTPTN